MGASISNAAVPPMDDDDKPIPWRLLPPGLQLDAVIAAQLDYTVTGAGGGFLWAVKAGYEDLPLSMPKWSTDLDAAVLLPLTDDATIEIEVSNTIIRVWINSDRGDYSGWGGRDQIALAVCRAWLLWKVVE